jgi:uncharacterized protein (TIGR04255 family)
MFYPVSGKHSISKVIAVLHLPQEVLIVEDVFNNLNQSEEISKNYQKRGLTVTKTIHINDNNVKVSNEITNGFLFEEFNAEGLTNNIFKLENNFNTEKAQLSFECNEYERWEGFIDRLIKDVSILNDKSKLLIEAISLTYIDEFEWDSDTESLINIDLLFNIQNDIQLEKLKQSHNGGLTIFTQSQFDSTNGQTEEKTEIYVNKDINRVSIVHSCSKRFPLIKMFDFEVIKENFGTEHQKNKNELKLLLKEDIQVQIGLN